MTIPYVFFGNRAHHQSSSRAHLQSMTSSPHSPFPGATGRGSPSSFSIFVNLQSWELALFASSHSHRELFCLAPQGLWNACQLDHNRSHFFLRPHRGRLCCFGTSRCLLRPSSFLYELVDGAILLCLNDGVMPTPILTNGKEQKTSRSQEPKELKSRPSPIIWK